jgi:hypothetical protein
VKHLGVAILEREGYDSRKARKRLVPLGIIRMKSGGFSDWVKWNDRNKLEGIKWPGVYAIVLCDRDISRTAFEWRGNIIYVGMTNSKGGLKSRLQQFETTIKGGDGHGGARRVRHQYPDPETLIPRLYVSINPMDCDVLSNKPHDLRSMGDVAKLEYECFAQYAEAFSELPRFNDKQKSPKK